MRGLQRKRAGCWGLVSHMSPEQQPGLWRPPQNIFSFMHSSLFVERNSASKDAEKGACQSAQANSIEQVQLTIKRYRVFLSMTDPH